MNKPFKTSIFIFRRALRIEDNTGLNLALANSDKVIPIFILTPDQLDDKKNSYKSDNCVQFMMESLEQLDKSLKTHRSRLFYFYGSPENVIEKIIKKEKVDAVFVNMDYSPYSTKRDQKIEKVCNDHYTQFISVEDLLLQPVGSVLTGKDTVYTKFTPFFNKAKKVSVSEPEKLTDDNFITSKHNLTGEYNGSLDKFYQFNPYLLKRGGRPEALKILKNTSEFKQYNKERNCLNNETTQLSAYIKFGCVSIREVYQRFKKVLGATNDLIKQLYWRDFYYNIMWGYPYVIGKPMKSQYSQIKWKNNQSHFEKWKKGKTGYPIVDAAMRSMNKTGFMHNRGRLIVSNFLIKLLMTDWRKGEKYFAQTLLDYDVANNNGNWQWGASTGADSQPYFRIMNPWTQGEKFDPNAQYIKEWIPELEKVSAKHLHQWDKYHDQYKDIDYPSPIIDYKKAREEALDMYKKVT